MSSMGNRRVLIFIGFVDYRLGMVGRCWLIMIIFFMLLKDGFDGIIF